MILGVLIGAAGRPVRVRDGIRRRGGHSGGDSWGTVTDGASVRGQACHPPTAAAGGRTLRAHPRSVKLIPSCGAPGASRMMVRCYTSRRSRHRVPRCAVPSPTLPRQVAAVVLACLLGACGSAERRPRRRSRPGNATPRDVNIVMRDYGYVPPVVDLVPGETVAHVINGGLEIHEAMVGDIAAQLAWEDAEAATIDHPPGPTPFVPPPEGFDGPGSSSGPVSAWTPRGRFPPRGQAAGGWFVGCHIPGPLGEGDGRAGPFVGGGCRARRPSRVSRRLAAPRRRLTSASARGAGAAAERGSVVSFRRCRSREHPRPKISRRASAMAYVIAEPCVDVMDLSCVSVCPVDCIHYDEGTDRKLFIDPDECIDCGACEPECPVNAIFPEESVPTEWAQYTQADACGTRTRPHGRSPTSSSPPDASGGCVPAAHPSPR